MTRFGLNRLGADPQLFTCLSHASFDYEIRTETLAHFPDIDGGAFEVKSRCPCNHLQPRDTRKRVDNLFADPVAKVVLLRLRAHVYERQHGNRPMAGWSCGSNLVAMFSRLSVKPSEDRDITAPPQSNQNRINAARPFLVICLQFCPEAASLDTNNCVNVRIVLRGAVEHLHCNRELLQAVDISIDCPIHDVRQESA